MDIAWGIIGAISGIIAILALAIGIGKYAGKVDDLCRMRDRISDTCTRSDVLWAMKDNLAASIIKADMLWKIYVEEHISHSNPGRAGLPDNLKSEIRRMLDNDQFLTSVKEPTLLIIDRMGLHRFSEVAKATNTSLGVVLAEVNSYVFSCLMK